MGETQDGECAILVAPFGYDPPGLTMGPRKLILQVLQLAEGRIQYVYEQLKPRNKADPNIMIRKTLGTVPATPISQIWSAAFFRASATETPG